MPTPNVTLEQLRAGIERPAGKMHKLVLHRIGAHFLELDVSFAHHSVVFLPVRPVDATEPRSKVPRPAQLVMLKHLFDYAAQHPGQKLLIAGHTDTSGSAFVNQRFSEARANSVYALLKGDRELWAKCCETRHETSDMQALLKWAAREHGFGCDPGDVDGKTGPKTISARERFRQRYNDEFSGHLKVEGPTTPDDWKAFFDLLEVSLARLLGVAEGQLASKRALLTFAKEPVLGCGEHWPVSSVGVDGLTSATNRRVDFVFLEEEGYPSLQQQTPPGYELYGMPLRFRRDVVEVEHTPRGVFKLETVDAEGHPIAGVLCEIAASGSEMLPPVRTDENGRAEIASIAHGLCVVRLPELDGALWRVESAAAARASASRNEDHTHVVEPGDTLVRIAWVHGQHDWRAIWDHPQNEGLRQRRASPHVLMPGDKVHVPGCLVHEVDSIVEGAERIVIDLPKMKVRLRLQDLGGEPFSNLSYECSYQVGAREVQRAGSAPTDGDGFLEEEVPVKVQTMTITLSELNLAFELAVGHLVPVRNEQTKRAITAGAQARLGALGYAVGPIDGKLGPRTRNAVREFQLAAMERQEATGSLDEETSEELARRYGV